MLKGVTCYFLKLYINLINNVNPRFKVTHLSPYHLKPFTINLLVREIIPSNMEHLAEQNTLTVNTPPRFGKSTLLPLTFLDEAWLR